tara:strand:+ start:1495 stop:1842 length:348 start_codon:yes stop_codon:yes gene_type:complete
VKRRQEAREEGLHLPDACAQLCRGEGVGHAAWQAISSSLPIAACWCGVIHAEMLNMGHTREMPEDLAARLAAEQALSGKARVILQNETGSVRGGRSPDERLRSSGEQNSSYELLG